MDGELFREVIQRVNRVAGLETLLILAVAALDLAVVARGVGVDQLVPDAKRGSSPLKQRRQIALAIGKSVGKFGPFVRPDIFNWYASAGSRQRNSWTAPDRRRETADA